MLFILEGQKARLSTVNCSWGIVTRLQKISPQIADLLNASTDELCSTQKENLQHIQVSYQTFSWGTNQPGDDEDFQPCGWKATPRRGESTGVFVVCILDFGVGDVHTESTQKGGQYWPPSWEVEKQCECLVGDSCTWHSANPFECCSFAEKRGAARGS